MRKADLTPGTTKGLIEEGNDWMQENAVPEVMDAGLIAAAQRVEHYEMAGYGSVHNFSQLLGEKEATGLLAETLQEEEATNKQLKVLAKSIDDDRLYIGGGRTIADFF
jgi:ferritin-like metal-binding protein YciE